MHPNATGTAPQRVLHTAVTAVVSISDTQIVIERVEDQFEFAFLVYFKRTLKCAEPLNENIHLLWPVRTNFSHLISEVANVRKQTRVFAS